MNKNTGTNYGAESIKVLKGLEEGQLVIVKGNENLRSNQAIKIKRKKK